MLEEEICLKTWDEYKEEKEHTLGWPWQKIDVKCPKCGKPIHRNSMVMNLVTDSHKYVCTYCGWEDVV